MQPVHFRCVSVEKADVLVTDSVQEPHELRCQILAAVQQFNDSHAPPNQLSVSVGVIAVSAADAGTLDELLTRADELMYADKKSKGATQVAAAEVQGRCREM